jgi:hypothetical protein
MPSLKLPLETMCLSLDGCKVLNQHRSDDGWRLSSLIIDHSQEELIPTHVQIFDRYASFQRLPCGNDRI